MSDVENKPLIEFPCEFPIKVMGKSHDDFIVCVTEIFDRHVPDFKKTQVKVRESGKGNYAAITVTIEAQSQQQLDNIYIDLSAHELVLMAL